MQLSAQKFTVLTQETKKPNVPEGEHSVFVRKKLMQSTGGYRPRGSSAPDDPPHAPAYGTDPHSGWNGAPGRL